MQEALLLAAELADARLQASQVQAAAAAAQGRAAAAEQHAAEVERRLATAEERTEAVVQDRGKADKRIQALLSSRDSTAAEVAAMRAEAAHRDAVHAELKEHATQAARLSKQVRREREEARALAAALQRQVEGLQERLKVEGTRRVMLGASAGARSSAGVEIAELRGTLAAVTAQNSTLKATAARLSRALASFLRQDSSGGGDGGHRGIAAERTKGTGPPGGWAAGHEPACMAEVLQQLTAVEKLLTWQ